MRYQRHRSLRERVWALVRSQHGVIARWQLLELGVNPQAIKHRIAKGRLHPVHRGVYAVGRPELTQEGRWMAAILRIGPDSCLSPWYELGLVVETDGWRYHRTPARQARDNRRMQRHASAGRTAVRFSHYEVRFEAGRVKGVLGALVRRLASRR